MKPRNKFEKLVAASNKELTAIGSKAVEWAVRNVVKHIAFRTSEHKCTCGDCGEKFDYKGKGKSVRCLHCGHRLHVTDTLRRKHQEKSYFSTLEVIGSLQVQRVFLLTVLYSKGKPMDFIMMRYAVCGSMPKDRQRLLQERKPEAITKTALVLPVR